MRRVRGADDDDAHPRADRRVKRADRHPLSDRTVGPMRPWGRSGYSASPRRAHGSRCRAQRRPGSWTESSSWDEAHEARTAKPRDIVQITTLQPGTTWA